MNNDDQTFLEKLSDKFADLSCFVKEKLDNISIKFKYWKINPIVVFTVLAAAAVIIVIAAVSVGKSSAPQFTVPCESGYEDRVYTMKRDKLTVTMRISDIRHYDRETGKSYSSTVYSEDYDAVLAVADYIFTNKGSEDIILDNSKMGGLYMGYSHDSDLAFDENSANDFLSGARLYISSEEKPEFNYSVTVGAKSTVEQRFCFIFNAKDISRINTLHICSDYDADNDDNIYAVLGAGIPRISFRFKNETFFPVLVRGSETEPVTERAANTPKAASASEKPPKMNVKYPLKTISAQSAALSGFNSLNKDHYSLSLKISSDKGNVSAAESGYSASSYNSARVGGMVEIFCDGETDGIELRFKISEEARKNTLGTYAAVNGEFEGIRRLNVFMYDEDINMLFPLETYFDESAHTVIAQADRCGSFCLMDMELWFDSLGISPEDAAEQ